MRSGRLQGLLLFLMALMATAVALVFADNQRALYQEENSRNMVTEQLSVIRSEMQGRITGNIHLLKGLVGALEVEPTMGQARFSALSRRMLGEDGNIAFVLAAPEMVVTMAYPPTESARVGFDFRKRNREHGAAFLAAQSRKVNISGPVDLPGGSKGLVVNYPVLLNRDTARPDLWGILSATINLNDLFQESGMLAEDLPINLAIARGNSEGLFGLPFFGHESAFAEDPVRMTVPIGQDYWLMTGAPKGGWKVDTHSLVIFRLILALAAAAILAPVAWAIRLMGQRQRAMRHLEQNSERLEILSRRLELALVTSRVGIWEHDFSTGLQYWDERVAEHFGIVERKPHYDFSDWESLLHPDDLEDTNREYEEAIRARQPYSGQYRVIRRDTGEIRHIRAFGQLIDATPGRERVLGVDWDITEDVRREEALKAARQTAEERNRQLDSARRQMEFNALHDALTGLPNRRYLDQFLAELKQGADEAPVTILHIDLDRFKDINDAHGHAAGDHILRHAADVLRASIGPEDFVARFGGDEFVVVKETPARSTDLEQLADAIIEGLNAPLTIDGHECTAGASIGIASQTLEAERPEQLLMNADIALYEAKKRGRGRVEFFTGDLHAAVLATRLMGEQVMRGLEQGEFITFFQPQFDAQTLEIDGVEALVRWEHPQRGIVPPDAFLRIAEDLNILHRIDEIVLDQALFHHRQWLGAGIPIPRVSVNISAQRLQDQRLMSKVESLQFAPGSICFELLESISFEEQDASVLETITRLKMLGIDIEIDDFGTGHASIVNLLQLTPRRLKIDRQLIRPILTSSRERQLVASIIDIGRACNIGIVAEGVETMQHADMLRDMGCQVLQGYALARPMRASDLVTFARNHLPRDRQPGRKSA